MDLKLTTNIPLIKDTDEILTAEYIIPYQKIRQDFRETAYQYEFLNKEDKAYIDTMLLVCEMIHNAFLNIDDDLTELRDENQSIYDLLCERLQLDIGEVVTSCIDNMDAQELKDNIIKVKGEDWYKEHLGEV